MSQILKRLVPPAVADCLRALLGRSIRFSGPYASWQEASRKSGGYHSSEILRKVAEATHKVVAGEAPYERDGVLFDRIRYSFPVLAVLLKAALQNQGRLTVTDFGGALGSSYREFRQFFADAILSCTWMVVEQARVADYGRDHFQTEDLKFCSSLSEAAQVGSPDVLLLSSVLQYLSQPSAVLEHLLELEAAYVVVDRTVVNQQKSNTLYVQHVPPSIYSADYPCWSLSEEKLMEKFERRYELQCDFTSLPFPALRRIDSEFKGYVFKKRRAA